MSSRQSDKTPLIAIISMSSLVNTHGDVETAPPRPQQSAELSKLLWSLWRLGVTSIVAQANEYSELKRAIIELSPPPLPVADPHPILGRLATQRQSVIERDLFVELPLTRSVELLLVPEKPLVFDTLKLCFHDELIGDPNAFLIHYGPSHFEVSGFHHPISAISIPVGDQVSASIIARLPYQQDGRSETIETCVIQLDPQGDIIKGPWWPKMERHAH